LDLGAAKKRKGNTSGPLVSAYRGGLLRRAPSREQEKGYHPQTKKFTYGQGDSKIRVKLEGGVGTVMTHGHVFLFYGVLKEEENEKNRGPAPNQKRGFG